MAMRLRLLTTLLCLACAGLGAGAVVAGAATVPSGFRNDIVFSELPQPTAVRFAADGRVFVAEETGRVVVFDSLSDPTPTVFADLRTDVYDSGDRGLLGLALDPEFPTRPYVYALYTYDHVLGEAGAAPKWGQPEHSGDACEGLDTEGSDACPVSGRVVRLTAEGGGDHATTDGGGEVAQDVLVEDWCQQFSSHSIGDLRFGADGALYASGGDGASFYDPDYGQFGWPQKNQCGDPPGGIGASLTPPSAEGGALRSQDVRTPGDPTGLDGSLIRIDPESGAGLPGNPLFSSPDANARRIVGYGFRNPFRFTLDPTHDELYVANVGWNTYEEIDRFASVPSQPYNSGWPCFEGPSPTTGYAGLGLSLCQSLYTQGGAQEPFFYYRHGDEVVPGDDCQTNTGSAVSGLAFYTGGAFPDAYDGALFFSDPVRGCIFVMFPGDDGRPDPTTTTTFLTEGGDYPGVDVEMGPDGALYYVQLYGNFEDGSIHRISYDPDAPVARLGADKRWGPTPLEVNFDAGESTDPNGLPLTYKWDLDGNGSFETPGPATEAETFNNDENVTVSVQVSDGLRTNVARLTTFPGDTPPEPVIEKPTASLTWRVGQDIEFAGFASDKEEAGGQLEDANLYWKARLYHCPSACHAHPLRVFPAVGSGGFTAPDHDYPSFLEIILTATDSRGLSASRSVSIYPRAVDLTIESDPPGLELGAGLLSQPTSFQLRAIEGSSITLTAPPTAKLDGQEYPWLRWNDGGERVHTIVANSSGTYKAYYALPDELAPRRPQTHIVKRPKKRAHGARARFAFTSDLPDSSFECRLDRGSFKPCHSPRVYRRLRRGKHVFRVRAINEEGRADRSAARFAWRILAKKR